MRVKVGAADIPIVMDIVKGFESMINGGYCSVCRCEWDGSIDRLGVIYCWWSSSPDHNSEIKFKTSYCLRTLLVILCARLWNRLQMFLWSGVILVFQPLARLWLSVSMLVGVIRGLVHRALSVVFLRQFMQIYVILLIWMLMELASVGRVWMSVAARLYVYTTWSLTVLASKRIYA